MIWHYPFWISYRNLLFVQCVCNLIMGIRKESQLTSLKNKQNGKRVMGSLWAKRSSKINKMIMNARGIEDSSEWDESDTKEPFTREMEMTIIEGGSAVSHSGSVREVTASGHVTVYWLCEQSFQRFETDWLLGAESVSASFCPEKTFLTNKQVHVSELCWASSEKSQNKHRFVWESIKAFFLYSHVSMCNRLTAGVSLVNAGWADWDRMAKLGHIWLL